MWELSAQNSQLLLRAPKPCCNFPAPCSPGLHPLSPSLSRDNCVPPSCGYSSVLPLLFGHSPSCPCLLDTALFSFPSYLSGCPFSVSIVGSASFAHPSNVSVLGGSVLGALLISQILGGNLILFFGFDFHLDANGSQIYASPLSSRSLCLHGDLLDISTWSFLKHNMFKTHHQPPPKKTKQNTQHNKTLLFLLCFLN